MALCPGKKIEDDRDCHSPLWQCKKCGNIGCEQGDANRCSNQGFRQGRCLKCKAQAKETFKHH